jgi:hypothetical protein
MEDAFDKAGARVFKGTIEPAQIARKAEKQMKREKLIGAGKQHAPTLYTVLISAKDDKRLFHFYPTMAAEVETHLLSRGADVGLSFDGRPLVRFIVDEKLRSGRFDVIAEVVAAPIISRLREEEAKFLGLSPADEQKSELPRSIIDVMPVKAKDVEKSELRAAVLHAHGERITTGNSSPGEAEQDFDEPEAAKGRASLIDHTSGAVYPLKLTRISIGRGANNDIVLVDNNASREHALLNQNALGKWRLVDLGSTNGTLVNGRLVDQTILRNLDELTIGVTILEFNED